MYNVHILYIDDAVTTTNRFEVFKKYTHIICNLAQPVTMATELYSKGMITQYTKNKAIQATGMVTNYDKNVHVLNEVENVIKYDSGQLAVFCSILQNIPNMKQYGDQILQEADLSHTFQCLVPVHVPSVIESISIQDDHQSVYVDYDIATDIMCLESKYFLLLSNTKAALHINAVPLETIQFFIEHHIGTCSVTPSLESLFDRLKFETSFLDYAIIKVLVETYVTDCIVKNECIIYIQEVKGFCSSTTLAQLKKECEEKIAQLPGTEKVLLKLDDRWDNVTITNFKRLLKITFRSMFTRMEVKNGSLVIAGIVLGQKITDIVTSWANNTAFMKAIGVLLFKVGDTVIFEAPEQEHTSITLEEGLSTALQSGNVSAVELLLAVSINIHPLSHTLISQVVAMKDRNRYTVLHRACQWGHDDVVQLLLDSQCDVNVARIDGWTPLMAASENSHRNIMKKLVSAGVDMNAQDNQRRTALHHACIASTSDIVTILLQSDADPTICNSSGRTPLMVACSENKLETVIALLDSKYTNDIVNAQVDGVTALYIACQHAYYDIVSVLLNAKADPNAKRNNGWMPLLLSSIKGYTNIVQLLLQHDAVIDCRSPLTGATALILACECGFTDIVKILLDNGANVNVQDNEGQTPLQCASINGHSDIIVTLLQFNADPELQDNKGQTPLYHAIINGHSTIITLLQAVDKTALHCACINKWHTNVITALLYSNTVHVNRQDEKGRTALHWTCINGYSDIIATLLQFNADPTRRDNEGKTPLHHAIINRHSTVITALLQSDAVNVNTRDNKGQTALHCACIHKQHSNIIIALLHSNTVRVNIKDKKGRTALHWTCINGYSDIIATLLQFNADPTLRDNEGKTPLHHAIINGHSTVIATLLQANAVPTIQDTDGYTPLMYAITMNNDESAQEILNSEHYQLQNSSAYINIRNSDGETALHLACKKGNSKIVSVLLNGNADPNISSKNKETALSIALNHNCDDIVKLFCQSNADYVAKELYGYCYHGNANHVTSLLRCGADLSVAHAQSGQTPLFVASYRNHKEIVNALLDSKYDIVNTQIDTGATALYVACQHAHYDITSILLNAKADPNIIAANGWTALIFASSKGYTNIVQLLLEHGADIDYKSTVTGTTALIQASEYGHIEIVRILLEKGADTRTEAVNKHTALSATINTQTDTRATALYVACRHAHYDIASILLNAKADPNIIAANGWTALTFASRKGYTNIVQLLLEHGADIDYRSTVTGTTALILASEHGHTDIVRILLEKGADTRIEAANNTALGVAGNIDIVEMLCHYQHGRARSVSQLLSISSCAHAGSFSDEKSLLRKATLSSDTASSNNSYKVMPAKDQTSLVTQTTLDSGVGDDGQSSDTTKDDQVCVISSSTQGIIPLDPKKDSISVVTSTSVDSGVGENMAFEVFKEHQLDLALMLETVCLQLSASLWKSGFIPEPLYNDISSRSSPLPESDRVQLMLLCIYKKMKQARVSDAAKMWESFLSIDKTSNEAAVQKLSKILFC